MSKTKKLKEQPKKILIYGDFVEAPTGFATVTRHLAQHLHKKGYIVDQVAINFMDSDRVNIPYLRYYRGAMSNYDQDTFGRKTLLSALQGLRGTNDGFFNDYDYVFLLQDAFILDSVAPKLKELQEQIKQRGGKVFQTIYYLPVDGQNRDTWLLSLPMFDKVVTFSDFGLQQIKEDCNKSIEYYQGGFNDNIDKQYELQRMNPQQYEKNKQLAFDRIAQLHNVLAATDNFKTVYHGTDIKTFKPLPQSEVDEFREGYFKEHKDKFIIGVVNRNQPRKDISRAIEIYKRFKDDNPEIDSYLYLHMIANDAMGSDVRSIANSMGLVERRDYSTMDAHGRNWQNTPPEVLNSIYNSLDVCLNTTLGEGWGLTITEAMAACCPVVAPNNTTIPEILGEGRGFIYDLEEAEHQHQKHDFYRQRHRADVVDGCAWLETVYGYPDKVDEAVGKAHAWVQKHSWQLKISEMIKIIEA